MASRMEGDKKLTSDAGNTNKKVIFRKVSAIRLYFQSFQYNKQTRYQISYPDLLATLGGWAGLTLGLSIISIAEFNGYLLILVHRLYHRK